MSRPAEALVSVITLALQLVQVTCIGYGPKPWRTITVVVTEENMKKRRERKRKTINLLLIAIDSDFRDIHTHIQKNKSPSINQFLCMHVIFYMIYTILPFLIILSIYTSI